MAIPVLLILAVLWAAVLVPPVLRSRTESRRGGIGDLHSGLGALNHRRSSTRSRGTPGPVAVGPAAGRHPFPPPGAPPVVPVPFRVP